MYNKDVLYFPMSTRVLVVNNTSVTAPIQVILEAQGKVLEYIEIQVSTGAIVTGAGVKVRTNEATLYPAFGSVSGSTFFADAKDAWGHLPNPGLALCLPFNRKLQGTPNNIILEFYNNSGDDISISILTVVSQEKNKPIEIKVSPPLERADPVKYPETRK